MFKRKGIQFSETTINSC